MRQISFPSGNLFEWNYLNSAYFEINESSQPFSQQMATSVPLLEYTEFFIQTFSIIYIFLLKFDVMVELSAVFSCVSAINTRLVVEFHI